MMRKDEVLGLVWDDLDLDLDLGDLAIGRQLQRVGRQLLHQETKTATSEMSCSSYPVSAWPPRADGRNNRPPRDRQPELPGKAARGSS